MIIWLTGTCLGILPSVGNMSVKPLFMKLSHGEKSSVDLNRSELYGLGLNIKDYNGPGARSSLGDGNSRHYRSASTETTGSKHPFAQSPRPYTPPIGQANSQRENEIARDSLAIDEEDLFPPRSESNLSSHRSQINNNNNNNTSVVAPLRIQTSRRSHGIHGGSQSNLQSPPLAAQSSEHFNTSATMSPASVRSSFDRALPRIRSRSDLTSLTHADAVRQARRQFQEKEAAKDRKYAQDEIRAMEKQAAREERKTRKSVTISEGARGKRTKSDVTNEKVGGLVGTDYNSTSHRAAPFHADSSGSDSYHQSRRSSTKKKTHSLWTEFVLWLRTRIFKLGRKATRR